MILQPWRGEEVCELVGRAEEDEDEEEGGRKGKDKIMRLWKG
jgi:hypothetical protein